MSEPATKISSCVERVFHCRFAFSLIELLVVLFILNILLALLLPAVQAAREQARKATCASRLGQLGLALHAYHDVHSSFPIANLPRRFWSWQAALLPYLDRQSIYNLINYESIYYCWETTGADLRTGRAASSLQDLTPYACPSDPLALTERGAGVSDDYRHKFGSYLGVSGSRIRVPGKCGLLASSRDGVLFSHHIDILRPQCSMFFPGVPMTLNAVIDGTSQTLFAGERGVPRTIANNLGWILCGTGFDAAGEGEHVLSVGAGYYFEASSTFEPGGLHSNDVFHFWSYHAGAGNFLFVDGSVHALTYNTDFSTIQALASRNGGETRNQ